MPQTDNDPSASTASFRAFAQRSNEDVARGRGASSNRTIIMVAAVVCALIVIGVLVATL
jgi:uncharacterized membrane protein YvbJ